MIPKRLLPDVRLNKKEEIPPPLVTSCDEPYEWQFVVNTQPDSDDPGKASLTGVHTALPFAPKASGPPMTVDWGDGNIETISSPSNGLAQDSNIPELATDNRGVFHEYASPGVYTVTINWNAWNTVTLDLSRLNPGIDRTSIHGWNDYEQSFNRYVFQATLIAVLKPLPLFNLNGWTDFGNISNNPHKIDRDYGNIVYSGNDYQKRENGGDPENATANAVTKSQYISLPTAILNGAPNPIEDPYASRYHAYSAEPGLPGAFFNCYRLSSIPEDLFRNFSEKTHEAYYEKYQNNTDTNCDIPLYNLNRCFAGCTSLKNITGNLLRPLKSLNRCARIFQGSGVKKIPSSIFSGNPNLVLVQGCFQTCPITKIPPNIFKYNPMIMNMDFAFAGTKTFISVTECNLFKYSKVLRTAYQTVSWDDVTGIGGTPFMLYTRMNVKIKSPYLRRIEFGRKLSVSYEASDLENPGQTITSYHYYGTQLSFSAPENSLTEFMLYNKLTFEYTNAAFGLPPDKTKIINGKTYSYWYKYSPMVNGLSRVVTPELSEDPTSSSYTNQTYDEGRYSRWEHLKDVVVIRALGLARTALVENGWYDASV